MPELISYFRNQAEIPNYAVRALISTDTFDVPPHYYLRGLQAVLFSHSTQSLISIRLINLNLMTANRMTVVLMTVIRLLRFVASHRRPVHFFRFLSYLA